MKRSASEPGLSFSLIVLRACQKIWKIFTKKRWNNNELHEQDGSKLNITIFLVFSRVVRMIFSPVAYHLVKLQIG